MKKVSVIAVAVLGAASLVVAAAASGAERGDDANRKSKNGRAAGSIDGVEIVVEYGRPHVRGRKIWGGLVPFGQVWRTGADEATTISFDQDVLINGEPLSQGRYGFFTIPDMESWTLIFNNTPDQWGAFSYDESDDALRVVVEPRTSDSSEEVLTVAVEEYGVVLRWDRLAVAFGVEADR